MKNDAIELYLNSVESNLICKKLQRKRIIESISSELYEFCDSNSGEPAYGDLVDRFGKPEELALSFLKNMNGGELKTRITYKKRVTLIAVLCAIALVAVGVVVGIHCYEAWHRSLYPNGYIEETPVYNIDGEDLTKYLEDLYGKENVY